MVKKIIKQEDKNKNRIKIKPKNGKAKAAKKRNKKLHADRDIFKKKSDVLEVF